MINLPNPPYDRSFNKDISELSNIKLAISWKIWDDFHGYAAMNLGLNALADASLNKSDIEKELSRRFSYGSPVSN